MILDPLSAVETGLFCLFNDCLEMTIVHVSQNGGELPTGPKFHLIVVRPFDLLEPRNVVISSYNRVFLCGIKYPLQMECRTPSVSFVFCIFGNQPGDVTGFEAGVDIDDGNI